jgi:hypothetical protein
MRKEDVLNGAAEGPSGELSDFLDYDSDLAAMLRRRWMEVSGGDGGEISRRGVEGGGDIEV